MNPTTPSDEFSCRMKSVGNKGSAVDARISDPSVILVPGCNTFAHKTVASILRRRGDIQLRNGQAGDSTGYRQG